MFILVVCFPGRKPYYFLMKISGSTHLNLTKKEELTTRAISSFGAGSRGLNQVFAYVYTSRMLSRAKTILFSNENKRFDQLEFNKKEELTTRAISSFGAGSRGRTDTVLLPSDFESDASANSTIPANGATIGRKMYYIIRKTKNQYLCKIFSLYKIFCFFPCILFKYIV